MTVTASAPAREVAAAETVAGALRGYFARLRGGDVGSLPAVLGFIVLVIFFTILSPDSFASAVNAANLLVQAAPVTFIAIGLVFVLLLGEIDLGAGFTAGGTAAVMGVLMTEHHIAWPISVLASLATGLVIGYAVGILVAWLGIPSFVVTLATFLGLQGMLLLIIGNGGTISISNSTILAIMNNNLSPLMSWVLFVIVIAGYGGNMVWNATVRRRAGLAAPSPAVMGAKILGVGVLLALATILLTQERSNNPLLKSLKGVPIVVPVALVFLVGLTFLLGRTAFGRHVYAVGGNTEAARRAGINVSRIKIVCFVIDSVMAAVAGILLASFNNSVSPSTGGSTTLLLAVGAAVIGGTSLFGGKGRVIDAILGGLVVAVIQNGLPLITQKAGVQYVVTGLVLLLAAGVDAISRRRAASTGG